MRSVSGAPVPTLPGHPLLGHLPDLARDALGFLTRLGHECGDVAHYRMGATKFVLVNNPDLTHRLLVDRTFERTRLSRKLMASFLGEGVFSQEGALHLQQRRLMQPAFHRARLEDYARVMVEETARLIHDLEDAARRTPNTPRDVAADMHHLTFRIVSRALFSDEGDDAEIVARALGRVQAAIDRQYELYAALPAWAPVVQGRGDARAIRELHDVIARIVRRRRAEPGDPGERGDLLGMLLAARDEDGSALTDAQVSGQSLSLLFAGHETTANTLSWALLLLAQHPAQRALLQAEVDGVLGGRLPGLADLDALPYTRWTVDEALRLYPPAWYAERTPTEPTELGGVPIRAGTPVVFSVYVTQRDPRFFPDPLAFDPERFSPVRRGLIPKHAYLPFGAGSHVCIGNAFALMEARLILATLVSRFDFELGEGFVPRSRAVVTFGIEGGLPMRLSRRGVGVTPAGT